MNDITPIRCERFELRLFSLEVMDALLAGKLDAAAQLLDVRFPDEPWLPDAERMLHYRRADFVKDPASAPWLGRAIVLPDGRMAGYIGFHGSPGAEGIAELGYTIMPAHRRQGLAQAAAECMMAWARIRPVTRRFRLSISPDNAPSLALAGKLGFTQTGEQMDEFDGLELIFERPAT